MTESLCCTTESSIVNPLYFNKIIFLKKRMSSQFIIFNPKLVHQSEP